MPTYLTNSEKETKNLAKKMAKKKRGVIALIGELGAGKTTFVQGFAKSLGIKEKIISPTFVLIRQHKIPSGATLYHVDLYRLEEGKNIAELGLSELWSNPQNLVLIEWAEKAEIYLPKKITRVELKKTGRNEREIIVS